MRRVVLACVACLAVFAAGCGGDDDLRIAGTTIDGALDSDEAIVPVLETSETILGQPLEWPAGPATLTSVVLTIGPGDETGPHYHEAPLYALVLEGTLTVDYGENGARTYREGDALMEAQEIVHNGMNTSDEPVKLLVLNMGAEGVANTVLVDG